jgi:two-component system response regulator MprA
MRILVVDDDRAVRESLRRSLAFNGYQVDLAVDGKDALDAVQQRRPDAMVLDVMMPRLDGLEVCRRMREAGDELPILVLTARDAVSDRVAGLDAGADDYLPKPFAVRELLARVRALLRRAEARGTMAGLELAGVRFDFQALHATGPSGPLDLTPHDIRVLKLLAERRGEVVPRIEIVEEVCGLDSDATLRTVDNHVMALRRAIGDDPRRPRFIKTVRGEGYVLSRDGE